VVRVQLWLWLWNCINTW